MSNSAIGEVIDPIAVADGVTGGAGSVVLFGASWTTNENELSERQLCVNRCSYETKAYPSNVQKMTHETGDTSHSDPQTQRSNSRNRHKCLQLGAPAISEKTSGKPTPRSTFRRRRNTLKLTCVEGGEKGNTDRERGRDPGWAYFKEAGW